MVELHDVLARYRGACRMDSGFDEHSLRDTYFIDVSGELDLARVPTLERLIEAAAPTPVSRIVVSLERCDYCDSAALHLFVKCWTLLGNRFRVIVPRGARCRRVFEIVNMDAAPFVVPTRLEALRR